MSAVGLLLCKVAALLVLVGFLLLLLSAGRPRLAWLSDRALVSAAILAITGLTLLLWSLNLEGTR